MFSDRLNSIQAVPGISEALTVLSAEFSTGIFVSPCKQEKFKQGLDCEAVSLRSGI